MRLVQPIESLHVSSIQEIFIRNASRAVPGGETDETDPLRVSKTSEQIFQRLLPSVGNTLGLRVTVVLDFVSRRCYVMMVCLDPHWRWKRQWLKGLTVESIVAFQHVFLQIAARNLTGLHVYGGCMPALEGFHVNATHGGFRHSHERFCSPPSCEAISEAISRDVQRRVGRCDYHGINGRPQESRVPVHGPIHGHMDRKDRRTEGRTHGPIRGK